MSHPRVSLIVLILACGWAAPASGESLAVIVHPERRADLDLDELTQIYLKKRRFWNDGAAVIPVNRNAGSDVRTAFDRALFGAEKRRLPVYWNREYFRGVLPPATLASGAAVKRFVASEIRAIGYIRSSGVDGSVRAVLRLEARGLGPAASRIWQRFSLGRVIEAIPVPDPRALLRVTALLEGPWRAGARAISVGVGSMPRTAGIGTALPETARGIAPGAD